MENPIRIHDLGVPLFLETPILYMEHIGHELSSFHPGSLVSTEG